MGFYKNMVYKCNVNRRDEKLQIFNAVICINGLDVPHKATFTVVK
jgi:hypothetical protein